MGNHHSASHASLKPRKNVHWKSAGRPATPGKPEIIPILSDDEPNAITLKWSAVTHDGGAPLHGYQVECNRLGSREWIRTAPPVVLRPELVLTGLEPPHCYQFRVAALNAVGRSEYSDLSDVLTISSDRHHDPPVFLLHLEDVTALENDKTEFRVTFTGAPIPTIAWFKDDYEIFSSRRTAITTNDSSSVLVFHQTLPSDEGEIKCTATNRVGHAVTKARLCLEAAPKLRYPRQYEDGLLYEINETVFLKTSIVGKPTPCVEWRHDGQVIIADDRMEISNTAKFSMLKIHSAKRSDRGEYQINAKNSIGEDTASFLVTITAPPDPPRRVSVTRQVDKSVTLDWEPPEDDGGCRIGNYVVEYYRSGWNVWLKATTSRKTNVTLFDLIEGSEYRFRVKAESPYGMSAPSIESSPVKIPGRSVDMDFLAVESRIINEVLTREDGQEPAISPVPRRKLAQTSTPEAESPKRRPNSSPVRQRPNNDEFMLVLYPDDKKAAEMADKRRSFQLDLEDALSPPSISFSAPDLSTRTIMPFKALRNTVSSTELLHERAMARFYKVVALKEEKTNRKDNNNNPFKLYDIPKNNNEQYNTFKDLDTKNTTNDSSTFSEIESKENSVFFKTPEIFIKTDSIEAKEYKYSSRQPSQDSENSENKWQNMSFDEDYTASTVSSDEDYDDDKDSLDGGMQRQAQLANEEETYNPRDKKPRPSPIKESQEEVNEILKPLPLPDPNFVPKPILKRPKSDMPQLKNETVNKNIEESKLEKIPNKDEKMTIFKKNTKIPVQKPFNFPKILNKKESQKTEEVKNENPYLNNKVEKIQDKISEEGRTVIDYYGNIVKEYGSQKKPITTLYLNTEQLKSVAEKQQSEKNKSNETREQRQINKPKKIFTNKPSNNRPNTTRVTNSVSKQVRSKFQSNIEKNENGKNCFKSPIGTQQILLKKTERATIVIPINYKELEEKAKVNVRSAIDYAVDMCLLLLAFWVYFFKDERLAIPLLTLIIYRQLQETIFMNIPEWVRSHTPNWLQKMSS